MSFIRYSDIDVHVRMYLVINTCILRIRVKVAANSETFEICITLLHVRTCIFSGGGTKNCIQKIVPSRKWAQECPISET